MKEEGCRNNHELVYKLAEGYTDEELARFTGMVKLLEAAYFERTVEIVSNKDGETIKGTISRNSDVSRLALIERNDA